MKKVLIVDDAAIMRKLIRVSFEKYGYNQFEEAATGVEALRKMKYFLPDLITLDINMPDGSGIELIPEFRALHPDVKILMITSEGKGKNVIDSVYAGANQFLVKPFSAETFSNVLNALEGSTRVKS